MKRNRFALILAATSLSACASGFVSSWKAPDATPLQVRGARVAAIVMMENEASRRAAEDTLARELTARGAEGVALYTILPDAMEIDNEAAVRRVVEEAGVEGAVVMRPVGTEREIVSAPITFTGATYGGFWGGYYGHGWRAPWGPVTGGEIRTNTIVSVETLVYSLRQNKLVWGGQSRTTNPASVDRLVRDTAEKVVKELTRLGLLPG
jgi:hypothetical protein